ncbi:hypothetical protein COJ27_29870 [Bacillus cereus]|uniref:WbqC family protein n=1 Tax=Bacillus cereus TaxID=1396 RepID=UPI000BF6DC43|nr:WbqC family protein [Bacillus cereus]PFL57211.1 hypothetical protein COJ27_29870 [Bacillus cereus]
MKVSIHQPLFFPWLGFWNKMYLSELFVLLDVAQYNKGDFQNRNRFRGPENNCWLTVPVKKSSRKTPINQKIIDYNLDWQSKHINRITSYYAKAQHFDEVIKKILPLYQQRYETLAEMNRIIITEIAKILSIKTKIIESSSLGMTHTIGGHDTNLNICKKLNANIYISGPFGAEYLNVNEFEKRDIDVFFHEFFDGNEPMSIIDTLMIKGIKETERLIKQNV